MSCQHLSHRLLPFPEMVSDRVKFEFECPTTKKGGWFDIHGVDMPNGGTWIPNVLRRLHYQSCLALLNLFSDHLRVLEVLSSSAIKSRSTLFTRSSKFLRESGDAVSRNQFVLSDHQSIAISYSWVTCLSGAAWAWWISIGDSHRAMQHLAMLTNRFNVDHLASLPFFPTKHGALRPVDTRRSCACFRARQLQGDSLDKAVHSNIGCEWEWCFGLPQHEEGAQHF